MKSSSKEKEKVDRVIERRKRCMSYRFQFRDKRQGLWGPALAIKMAPSIFLIVPTAEQKPFGASYVNEITNFG